MPVFVRTISNFRNENSSYCYSSSSTFSSSPSSSSSCTVAASTASVNLRPALQQSHRQIRELSHWETDSGYPETEKLKGIKETTLSHWNQFSPKKDNLGALAGFFKAVSLQPLPSRLSAGFPYFQQSTWPQFHVLTFSNCHFSTSRSTVGFEVLNLKAD